jgi:flagellar assembly protein FliH
VTRNLGAPSLEAVSSSPVVPSPVRRDVVMGREARVLARPRTDLEAMPLSRPPRYPVGFAVDPETSVTPSSESTFNIRADASDVPFATAQLQSFQAGYADGHSKGYAEGLQASHDQDRADGFRTGLEQGRRAAQQEAEQVHAAAKKACAARVGNLDALLAALPVEFDRRLAQTEDEMLGLCFEALSRMVGEAAASPEGQRAMVRQAVLEANSQAVATIHVNPRDLENLQNDQELAAWLGSTRRVQWLGDDRIKLGGCLVSAPDGGLDARLETQMARLASVFAKARKERGQ